MPQQSTCEPAESAQQPPGKARTPFVQRLWRNQAGILLAVALTLAAAAILLLSRQA